MVRWEIDRDLHTCFTTGEASPPASGAWGLEPRSFCTVMCDLNQVCQHLAPASGLFANRQGGCAPGSLCSLPQAIINKLWLGHDLQAAIEAPILHVDSKGQVEYEPSFSQEVQKGLLERGQCRAERPFFLNVVQAVSQEKSCVYAASDPRKGGEASGY